MSPHIPDPEYITETVDGTIYALPGRTILIIGAPLQELSDRQSLLSGEIVLRFALTTLIPPSDVIIPGLFAAEKGGMLTGREAWDFLQRQFQMHPRADVVGFGLLGQPVQKLVREMDFGVPVRVFAYADHEQASPTVELNGLFIADDAAAKPELAAQYLPLVTNLESWLSTDS